MSGVLFNITVAVYFIATAAYIVYLVSHAKWFLSAGKYVLLAGFLAHTAAVASRWGEAGRMPAASFHESLLLFSWLLVAVYSALLLRYKLSVLGAFVAPLALVFTILAAVMPADILPLAPVLESWWLPVHVGLALLGNAFFALASLFGVMYLVQEHYLKTRRIKGLFFVLPSVEITDELNYRCLTYGFPLLTLAMITGALWSQHATGEYWVWGQRQIWSLITWFLYAALLHGRLTSEWRGRKSAIFSVAAFIVLIASFLIINLILGGAHGLSR